MAQSQKIVLQERISRLKRAKGNEAADLLLVGMVPREALEEAVVALETQKRACAELGAQLADSQRAQLELSERHSELEGLLISTKCSWAECEHKREKLWFEL